MPTYTVAHLGCGPRGRDHIRAIAAAGQRLKLLALCDKDAARLNQAAQGLTSAPRLYGGADEMLAAHRVDIFSFCTQPETRLALVELGIKHGVKAIVLEKPMATSLSEARAMCQAAQRAGVKLVISHQHKYAQHWQNVKRIVSTGQIGRVRTIHATSLGWMMHYATHLIDYAMWLNDYSPTVRVAGHVHGRDYMASGETHPSPGYFLGHLEFANEVRGIIECGTFAPPQEPGVSFWMNAGATVVGTEGLAQVVVGKGWRAVTKSGVVGSNEVSFRGMEDSIPLHLEVADWLDDPTRLHCCRGELACHGFEVMLAICQSALEKRRIDLPLKESSDTFARLLAEVPA
jgi:predicted dehydrogenase